MTTVEQIAQVERGTPFETFPRLASYLGVSEGRLQGVLGFAAATLHRRKVAGRFMLEESNRLYWLTNLIGTAELVLGDPHEVKDFMTLGNLALGGAVPLDYARTAPGLEAVRRLLQGLDHGVVV